MKNGRYRWGISFTFALKYFVGEGSPLPYGKKVCYYVYLCTA